MPDLDVPMSSNTVGPFCVNYSMHKDHRQKLVEKLRAAGGLPTRSLLLFKGGVSAYRDETDHEPVFRQESTFHYLFGVREPDCLATVNMVTGESMLYIPRLPREYATWMGEIMPPSHFQ
ncbi:unnamed protein product, partial [Choristocarpus tenellus]